jgi:hypothetical protein
MADSCTCGADGGRRRLLAFLGAAMVATGQPVDEVEHELREVGRHLGAPDVQVATGPTGVHVGLASGDPATFGAVDGRLRLDQAADVRLVRHLLELPAVPGGGAFQGDPSGFESGDGDAEW